MTTRNIVLTKNQTTLINREDAVLQNLRSRLTAGLEQARRGELAEGSGKEVIRRAFTATRPQT